MKTRDAISLKENHKSNLDKWNKMVIWAINNPMIEFKDVRGSRYRFNNQTYDFEYLNTRTWMSLSGMPSFLNDYILPDEQDNSCIVSPKEYTKVIKVKAVQWTGSNASEIEKFAKVPIGSSKILYDNSLSVDDYIERIPNNGWLCIKGHFEDAWAETNEDFMSDYEEAKG